jgi:hypothetical protein
MGYKSDMVTVSGRFDVIALLTGILYILYPEARSKDPQKIVFRKP